MKTKIGLCLILTLQMNGLIAQIDDIGGSVWNEINEKTKGLNRAMFQDNNNGASYNTYDYQKELKEKKEREKAEKKKKKAEQLKKKKENENAMRQKEMDELKKEEQTNTDANNSLNYQMKGTVASKAGELKGIAYTANELKGFDEPKASVETPVINVSYSERPKTNPSENTQQNRPQMIPSSENTKQSRHPAASTSTILVDYAELRRNLNEKIACVPPELRNKGLDKINKELKKAVASNPDRPIKNLMIETGLDLATNIVKEGANETLENSKISIKKPIKKTLQETSVSFTDEFKNGFKNMYYYSIKSITFNLEGDYLIMKEKMFAFNETLNKSMTNVWKFDKKAIRSSISDPNYTKEQHDKNFYKMTGKENKILDEGLKKQ